MENTQWAFLKKMSMRSKRAFDKLILLHASLMHLEIQHPTGGQLKRGDSELLVSDMEDCSSKTT